ncbi:MAG: oligosaccharide flippase family protein [Dehalococcoidia bacterium]|nr:oligosaccharide flippase family protein [Dehalococcoidia bacterium]
MTDGKHNEEASSQSVGEPQRFALDIIWVAIAQVFTSAIAIFTLPALTKSYSSETFGIWVQVSMTVSLLTPLFVLQLGTALVRFLTASAAKEKKRQIFGAMLIPILVFSGLVAVAAMLLAQHLSSVIFASPAHATFVRLAVLWTIVEALFFFGISYLRADGKIKTLSTVSAGVAVAKMVLIVTLAKSGFGLQWVIISVIVAELGFTLVVFGLIIREIGFPKPNTMGLGEFLAFSIPQLPSSLLLWIVSSSDRYFITHLISISQAGVYSSSNTLASLMALFYAPIGFVLYPTLSKAWEQNRLVEVRNYLEYSTKLFLTLAIPATAGLAILSQALLNLLTTPEFLVGGRLVLLVAIGAVFLGIYQMNLYIVLLVRKTKWLPLFVGAAAAISVGTNVALIPRIGIMGAAVSNIASYFLLASIVSLWARETVHYSIDLLYLGKVIVATLVMGLCLWVMDLNGPFGIILGAFSGMVIFGIGLLLMRAFSEQDKQLVRETVRALMPSKR